MEQRRLVDAAIRILDHDGRLIGEWRHGIDLQSIRGDDRRLGIAGEQVGQMRFTAAGRTDQGQSE